MPQGPEAYILLILSAAVKHWPMRAVELKYFVNASTVFRRRTNAKIHHYDALSISITASCKRHRCEKYFGALLDTCDITDLQTEISLSTKPRIELPGVSRAGSSDAVHIYLNRQTYSDRAR